MSNVSEEVWTHSNIAVMAIGTTYSTIFLYLTTYNYLGYNKKNEINKPIIYATILHVASWLIHFCASMTTYIGTIDNRHNNHDGANYTICLMLIIHPITFYTIMICRLHFAFKSSAYKLTKFEFIVVMMGVLGTCFAMFFEQGSWILIIAGDPPMLPIETLINCLWSWIAFDVATRILVMALFVRKLFGIVMKQTDDRETSRTRTRSIDDAAAKPDPVVLNMVQIQFLSIIKKVTLLGVFGALPVTLARIIFVIDFHANNGVFTHENWITFNSLQCIAVFMELISIISTFRFNEGLYYLFCRYCDSGCAKCCQYEARRKITSMSNHEMSSDNSAVSPSTSGNNGGLEMESTQNTDIVYTR